MRPDNALQSAPISMKAGKCSALVAGLFFIASCSSPESRQIKYQLADAFPPFTPSTCVAPNPREQQSFELATAAIELDQGDIRNMLTLGAQKYLANHSFRSERGDTVAVCLPDDILKRLSVALDRNGLGKGRLVEYQLELASRLPDPSPAIVDAVGRSAFNESVQESELYPRRDIRPYARSILAGFGTQSKPFGEMAYEQMSIKTSMGTGAAQVAAAAGHPKALPRIQRMMEDALVNLPADEPIPRDMRNRLYELSWAIAYSGAPGKGYTGPIHQLMQRKVESWAPPFGMVALRPRGLCGVIRRIEGDDSLQAYPFCLDAKVPMEQ